MCLCVGATALQDAALGAVGAVIAIVTDGGISLSAAAATGLLSIISGVCSGGFIGGHDIAAVLVNEIAANVAKGAVLGAPPITITSKLVQVMAHFEFFSVCSNGVVSVCSRPCVCVCV